MIKQNKLLTLVLVNSLLALVLDLTVGYKEFFWLIIALDVPIIIVNLIAFRGLNWAYLTLLIYYFIRSFNYYFSDFYLMTKNGLNIEISINSIGVNILSVVIFILLVYSSKDKFNSDQTKKIRTVSFFSLLFILSVGFLTRKDAKYDLPENNQLVLELDTTTYFEKDYFLDIPRNWEVFPNYQNTSLFALSNLTDSLDTFRENFNVQVFNINYDIYSSEEVAKNLFEGGMIDSPYQVELLNEEFYNDFYAIDYLLGEGTVDVHSKMYCKVINRKVYSIIFSDHISSFNENLEMKFLPILMSLKLN